jgi:hypothetical protein
MSNVYTGANGTLVFSADTTNAPEGADATAVLQLGAYNLNNTTVGRVTGVEVHVNTDLQGYYQIGQRHPVSLHPENIHIGGVINRAYINGALLYLLLGRGARPSHPDEIAQGPYPEPTLKMVLTLKDPAVPSSVASITLHGVKFENWGFSIPEDDFVMEKVAFKALFVEVNDQQGSGTSGPAAVTPSFSGTP